MRTRLCTHLAWQQQRFLFIWISFDNLWIRTFNQFWKWLLPNILCLVFTNLNQSVWAPDSQIYLNKIKWYVVSFLVPFELEFWQCIGHLPSDEYSCWQYLWLIIMRYLRQCFIFILFLLFHIQNMIKILNSTFFTKCVFARYKFHFFFLNTRKKWTLTKMW